MIITVIALAGCKKDDDDPKGGTITLTTAMTSSGRVIIWMAGSGEAVINWGDGSAPEKVTLSEYTLEANYGHIYSDVTSRTIVIDGQNITHLDCYSIELTALDVTNNTALRWLNCDNNNLTSLDMSKNTALTHLGCSMNELTAVGLNSLFGTLHSNAGDKKDIVIGSNPGTDACGRSIATAKGWKVETTGGF